MVWTQRQCLRGGDTSTGRSNATSGELVPNHAAPLRPHRWDRLGHAAVSANLEGRTALSSPGTQTKGGSFSGLPWLRGREEDEFLPRRDTRIWLAFSVVTSPPRHPGRWGTALLRGPQDRPQHEWLRTPTLAFSAPPQRMAEDSGQHPLSSFSGQKLEVISLSPSPHSLSHTHTI